MATLGEPRERWPWAKLDAGFMLSQATDASLPAWQRVSFAAWTHVDRRGTARFAPGELAELCAIGVDAHTGEIRATPESVKRKTRAALNEAVRHGWIEDGSTATAVIVSRDVAAVGAFAPVQVAKPTRDAA